MKKALYSLVTEQLQLRRKDIISSVRVFVCVRVYERLRRISISGPEVSKTERSRIVV